MKLKILPILLSMVLTACMSPQKITRPKVAFCEVAERPDKFNGKLITIDATAEGDSHYNIGLYDPSCPGKSIVLLISKQVEKKTSTAGFISAIWRNDPPDFNRVDVTVEGKFYWDSKQVPSRLLIAQEVALRN